MYNIATILTMLHQLYTGQLLLRVFLSSLRQWLLKFFIRGTKIVRKKNHVAHKNTKGMPILNLKKKMTNHDDTPANFIII